MLSYGEGCLVCTRWNMERDRHTVFNVVVTRFMDRRLGAFAQASPNTQDQVERSSHDSCHCPLAHLGNDRRGWSEELVVGHNDKMTVIQIPSHWRSPAPFCDVWNFRLARPGLTRREFYTNVQ